MTCLNDFSKIVILPGAADIVEETSISDSVIRSKFSCKNFRDL
jgi:hypothetical protein